MRQAGMVAVCLLLLGALAAAPASAYPHDHRHQRRPVVGRGIPCHRLPASSSDPWGSCGSSVAAGTQVSTDVVANEGYWFMWFGTNPYLAGCSTTNWGWGYHANPQTHCGFTMPSSNANINAEFQLP